MMHRIIFLSTFLAVTITTVLAQPSHGKRTIDFDAMWDWEFLAGGELSGDGLYFTYTVRAGFTGKSIAYVQTLKGDWKHEENGISGFTFTADSKVAIYQRNDTLFLLRLGTSSKKEIPNVRSFRLFNQGKVQVIAYQLKSPDKSLVIHNLSNGNVQSFANVINYTHSNDGRLLFLITAATSDGEKIQTLSRLTLVTNGTYSNKRKVGEGASIKNLVLSDDGLQLSYVVEEGQKDGLFEKSFWLYREGDDSALQLLNNSTANLSDKLELGSIIRFTHDGERLFIQLEKRLDYKPNFESIADVWSTQDPILQSVQLATMDPTSPEFSGDVQTYVAALNIDSKRIVELQNHSEKEGERIIIPKNSIADDFVIAHNRVNQSEDFWLSSVRPSFDLISVRTGQRIKLPVFYPYSISPKGTFVLGYDSIDRNVRNNVFSYNLKTGKVINLTRTLPVPCDTKSEGSNVKKHRDLEVQFWMPDESALVVTDHYDLWLLDAKGKKAPINLTNGFGRKNKVSFKRVGKWENTNIGVFKRGKMLLYGFDEKTKETGFYLADCQETADPELLSKGPYVYQNINNWHISPEKALYAGIYVVSRDSAGVSKNYFYTKDFKTFTQLTYHYFERDYNWYTKELHTFKSLDGKTVQGILYKPENFDPSKKYPVIFHYYEKLTNYLNEYRRPFLMSDRIDIPYMVSRGYLVFEPEISIVVGKAGETALNTVEGAADYLSNFAWVDETKMAVSGHSFGGFETNYIITHSNRYAAALTASGIANYTSTYGSVMLNSGKPAMGLLCEIGQTQMGTTLWGNPKIYIDNSPVLTAHKITTPLLIMHNKSDAICEFQDAVQFFTGLRRLGKTTWMLQYDGEAHSLATETAQKDYTIRVTEFFDHYLKDAPSPKWMTHGVVANKKRKPGLVK